MHHAWDLLLARQAQQRACHALHGHVYALLSSRAVAMRSARCSKLVAVCPRSTGPDTQARPRHLGLPVHLRTGMRAKRPTSPMLRSTCMGTLSGPSWACAASRLSGSSSLICSCSFAKRGGMAAAAAAAAAEGERPSLADARLCAHALSETLALSALAVTMCHAARVTTSTVQRPHWCRCYKQRGADGFCSNIGCGCCTWSTLLAAKLRPRCSFHPETH